MSINKFVGIDTEFESYFIGLVMSSGICTNGKVRVFVRRNDFELIKNISSVLPIISETSHFNSVSIDITSPEISNNIIKQLQEFSTIFSKLNNELKRAFVRGYFDVKGLITSDNEYHDCLLIVKYLKKSGILKQVCEFANVPFDTNATVIKWSGLDALDFLGKLYMNSSIHSDQCFFDFSRFVKRSPDDNILPSFEFSKTDKDAFSPVKSRMSDSGYDLYLLKKIKEVNGVHYYDTCIQVKPAIGYCFDLVGRSSIAKTGWTLANNVGIIDMTYRGSVIVALVPSVPTPKEIVLPCKLVQLIPRKVIMMSGPTEVSEIGKTARGDSGGLGSKQFKY
jgi:dUTPase